MYERWIDDSVRISMRVGVYSAFRAAAGERIPYSGRPRTNVFRIPETAESGGIQYSVFSHRPAESCPGLNAS